MISEKPPSSKRSFTTLQRQIRRRLDNIAGGRPNFWDFRESTEELVSKTLFQYPAMMVPALQRQVMAALLNGPGNVETIVDPFLGSGTILALAMLNGRSFVGQDINPLSILLAKTRAFSLNHPALSTALDRVTQDARRSRAKSFAVRFVGQSKWFTDGASIGLSRLRRYIRDEPERDTRRFLWVCLAEAIRLNSNSRTSTFKLHVKPADERDATMEDVLDCFETVGRTNVEIVKKFVESLCDAGHVDGGFKYKRPVKIVYGTSTNSLPSIEWAVDNKCDLVVTSPPYGDNRTTVPYGQAAWLPLQWIDLTDIDCAIPRNCARHAYDVDNRSLGGIRDRKLFQTRKQELSDTGPITSAYISQLSKLSGDGISRFVHFAFDLKQVMRQIANICAEGTKIVLTLGHRNISQTVCPLTDLCAEILSEFRIKEVARIDRQIPSKRMPGKNSHSATINHEYISILHQVS